MPRSFDPRPDGTNNDPSCIGPRRSLVIIAHASADLRQYLCEQLATFCDVATCAEGDPLPVANLEHQSAVLIIDDKLPRLERDRFTQELRIDQRAAAAAVVWIRDTSSEGSDAAYSPSTEPDAYLVRPLSGKELRTTVRTLLELTQLRQDKALQATQRDHVIDNFRDSFIAVDANWRVTHINSAAERYINVQREDVLGKDAWAVFAVDPYRAQVYQQVMLERVAAKLEGSSPEYGSFQIDAIPFEDGGLGVYFRNADRLKAAEAAAFASEQRLRLFLEHAKDYALVLLDPQERVVEWLGGAEKITGWSSEDMVGETLKVMFTPEDLTSGQAEQEFRKAAETGRAADMRWHQKKDGSRFFAEGVNTAFRDESGELQGFGKIFRNATSQKLAEDAVRESEEKLQLIVNSVADGIYSVTHEGYCGLLNLAGAAMLGYEPEELEGRQIHEIIHHHRADGTDYPAEDCRIALAIREGLAVRVDDEVFWHKDGTPIPVQYSVNPMMSHGDITGAVVAFTDITERKRAEAALAESARRLRFVMDFIPQKIFTATPDGEVDYLNPAWEDFSGRKSDQIRREDWVDLLHPDELEENRRVWRRSVENAELFQLEHRFRDAQGQYRWHLTRALPMRNEAGQVVMWIGSNTDIHDIKTAEFELTQNLAAERRSVALLSDVAAASHTINSVLSVEGIGRILTEEAREILGVRRAIASIARGREHVSIILEGPGHKVRHGKLRESGMCAEVCRTGESIRLTQAELEQYRGREAFGDDCCEYFPENGWLAVPLTGHGSKNIGLVHVSDKYEGEFAEEDQAILKQLAAIAAVGIENASLYDSLREQDRRKDDFLATLAHELRNPLAPLQTGLDILQLSVADERAFQICRTMERQLSHMVRLIDDLIDVSRISRGKVELKRAQVRLKDVVDLALEATAPFINSAEHRLSVFAPDEELYVHGDLTRLAQVLSNLLNNAAKYTPKGGAIELLMERVADQAIIRVTDTGVGLASETLPTVFDIFTQVRSGNGDAHGGLGIGLSLVQQFVEMHGGTVAAESRGPGNGSTFTVTLPLSQAGDVSSSEPSEPNGDIGQKRILVVDDNTDAADGLAMLLRLAGHEVAVAYKGEEGISAAVGISPHLVFLDIGLPDMSGYEVASALRKEPALNDSILVAVTGWGSDEDRRRSREAGFDLHLAKPINSSVIAGVLNRFFPANP